MNDLQTPPDLLGREQRMWMESASLSAQWKILHEKLTGLRKQHAHENRSEEKLRQGHLITETEQDRGQVERKLKPLELELRKFPAVDLEVVTKQYLSYLQQRHQFLQLKGMGFSERIPLQLPLLDLYIPLQARREMPFGETWSRVAGRVVESAGRLGNPQSVLNLLRQNHSLIILGDPGAGKTTFLKYLALQLAAGQQVELGLGERLPILVPLSGYANALENADVRLDDFIAGYFHDIGADLLIAQLLADALKRGIALVLLDGLDEVKDDSKRHLVVERVVDFYTLHHPTGNKFVLTSRIIGYKEVRPTASGLAECMLVDFDDGEIEAFVERWTAALEKQAQGDHQLAQADAERERHDLLEVVRCNPGVRQLAANPLLLTILALMKRNYSGPLYRLSTGSSQFIGERQCACLEFRVYAVPDRLKPELRTLEASRRWNSEPT